MPAELRGTERAAAAGTKAAGSGPRAELRRQITGAGLGQPLANRWRDSEHRYQTLDAARLVYTEAPQTVRRSTRAR
jgi:hypothetical protein